MSAVTEQSVEMVNIEVDGIAMEVPKNSMIIEATDKAGIDVPRFCYHQKLTIAANCRMCLVDVEKTPKPLAACATPVMDGMKVYTQSRRAIDAQHGVMEFLLINHPLDCPICDQAGECELQDLAMGYGRSVSRFTERKRVVKDKNVGPLIQTDMTRCIHCTRCVRFLEEIAGTSEMGGTGRADNMEIGTCIETSIESELSGNIIDICPVGALTDKPFRFTARAWELVAQPCVALHDGVGSSLYYHTLRGKVLRAVPRDREDINETWLSDRDRYSHFGLYSQDRILAPQLKVDGQWTEVSWAEAIEAAAAVLRSVDGGDLGVLMSPAAATEEYFLAQRLARGLGCNHIDHRLREHDFADDVSRIAQFEMRISEIENADSILLVGSNIRHEAPIIGHRVRKAWRSGARVMAVNPLEWNFHFGLSQGIVAAPQHMVAQLAALAAAVAESTGQAVPGALVGVVDAATVDETHRAMAESLNGSDRGLVIVGQMAMSHHHASWLRQLAAWIASATGGSLNLLPNGANAAGAVMAGAIPYAGPGGVAVETGMDARRMLEQPLKAYLLWDFEPDFDTSNPTLCQQALLAAGKVIAVTSFATSSIRDVADIILPLAPQQESEGSMVNLDGRKLNWRPAGKISGDCRSGWKILRRLGAELGLEGFDQVNIENVRQEMKAALASDDGGSPAPAIELPEQTAVKGLYRVGEVPMYAVDALCRRSEPLQKTAHADSRFIGLNPGDAMRLGLSDGDTGEVSQGDAAVEMAVRVKAEVPEGAAWVRSATCASRVLGDQQGPVTIRKSGGAS